MSASSHKGLYQGKGKTRIFHIFNGQRPEHKTYLVLIWILVIFQCTYVAQTFIASLENSQNWRGEHY